MKHNEIPIELFKTVAEFAAEWLMCRMADGTIAYISPAVEEITGYPRETFLSNPEQLFQIVHPEDQEAFRGGLKKELEDPNPCVRVFRILHKDGAVRWISHRCRPVFDPEGKVLCRVSSNRDITKEKQTGEALRESEARYKGILRTLPDIVFVINREYVFTDCYTPFPSMLLMPCEKIVGRAVREILPEFLADLTEKKVQTAVETGQLQVYEYSLEVTGEKRWFEARVNPRGKDETLAIIRDITERKKAETTLRIQEEKYETLYKFYRLMSDNIPDLVWAKDLEGRYLFVNRAICEKLVMARDTEEPIGKTDLFFANRERSRHPDRDDWHTFGELCVNSDEIVLKSKKAQRFDEYGNVRGKFLYLDVYKAPIFDEEGKIIGTVGHGRVVTKEKKIEKKLVESEKRYRQLFESSIDAIYINSLDGRIIDINPVGLRLLGLSKFDEADIVHASNFYQNPKDRQKLIAELKKQGFVRNYELNLKKADGTKFTAMISAALLYDEGGTPIAIQGILRDITEQKAREKALRRLATVIEQAAQSIVITDLKGNIEYVNPAFEEMTGYAFEEVKGKNPRILQSGQHDREFYRNLWKTIASGKTWHGIFLNKKREGALYYERAVLFPIKDAKGQIINYAAVKQDITEEKQLESQLLQAQKMETIGQLAGGIAHDFNNLLNIIKGYSELALLRMAKDAPGYREISAIQSAGKRAETLVGQLMAFSRKQVYAPRVIDINEVITKLEGMLRRIISEDIQLQTLLSPNLPFIKADPNQIEQILVNIAINARDAIKAQRAPSDKKIMIKTRDVEFSEAYTSRHFDFHPGRYIQISVSDTGIGMDTETQRHIFEPFFTTKEEGKGTGLGLSTVYGIVKQNHGYIHVYSEPGRGTTFEIYWPVTEELTHPHIEERRTSKASPRGHESILFVEDEEELRNLTAGVLREYGYRVTEASDGMEALKHLEDTQTSFDLIITDLVMPRMNGDELARKAEALRPGIKVFFTSGYTNNHIIHNGILKEGLQFLHKPYSFAELFHKIRQILDHV